MLLLVTMEISIYLFISNSFFSPHYYFFFSAVMSVQNELITAKDGSHTVRDGRGSQIMSDGLTCLFTLDSQVFIY